MLIEPASKVSVPLTVVMRNLSSVPERVTSPAFMQLIFGVFLNEPHAIHVLLESNVRTICPLFVYVAVEAYTIKPDVPLIVSIVDGPKEVELAVYPDVLTEPEPI